MSWFSQPWTIAAAIATTAASTFLIVRRLSWLRTPDVDRHIREKESVASALKTAEAKYRRIFENAVEGIIQTSPDGKFLVSNPAFARTLGYDSPEELLESVKDITSQIYVRSEVREDFLRRILRYGKAKVEYEAWRKDGSTVWIAASSRAVHDDHGR